MVSVQKLPSVHVKRASSQSEPWSPERRVGNFKPQKLANTAWAFATLGQPDARLFTALAKEAERRVCNFKPQDLANTAWAFATLGQPDAQLFTALAREAEHRVGNLIIYIYIYIYIYV